MKKYIKIIIWSLIFFIVVAVGAFCGRIIFENKVRKGMTIIECLPSEIVSYSVDDGKGNQYRIVRTEEGWKVENNDVAVIDNEKAEKLISCASKIVVTEIVDKKEIPSDKTDAVTVKIGLPEDEVITLTFFGNKADKCMLAVSGERHIYRQNVSMRDILAPALDELRILEVFADFNDSDKMPELYEYTDYDGSKISIRIKNGGELAKSDINQYVMTEPYYREIDDDKFIQQVVVKLPDIIRHGSSVEDKPENPAVYGLDVKNRASLKVKRKGVEETLFLGRDENGIVYASKRGSEEVFSIKSSQLDFLKTEPFYLINNQLIENKFKKVDRILLTSGKKEYSLCRNVIRDGDEWFSLNGKNTTVAVFDEIISELNTVEVVSELITVPENTKDYRFRIYGDGKRQPFEFTLVPAGEREYAVYIDNNARFAADKQTMDEIIDKIKK